MMQSGSRVYGFEMARIAEVYLSKLSSLMSPNGLDRYYTPFLCICKGNGRLTQKDLGEMIKRDKVNTTRIIDHLCDLGLVIRQPDNNDRRCHLLTITEKAKAILPEVERSIEQTNDFLLRDLKPDERNEFLSHLETVFEYIDAMPKPEFIVHSVKTKSD